MDIKKVDELLKASKISQKDLCKKIGIKEQSYSNIKASGVASIEIVLKIAKELNVHPSEISPEFSDLFNFSQKDDNQTSLNDNIGALADSIHVVRDLASSNKTLTNNIEKLIDQSNINQNTIISYSNKLIEYLTSSYNEKRP